MADKKKKSKFNLYNFFFNPNRDIEDAKGDCPVNYNFTYFFKLYFRNFGRLFSINLFFIFGNFPIIFAMLGFSGLLSRDSFTPLSSMFPAVFSMVQSEANPVTAALYTVFGIQTTVAVPSFWTYLMYALGALVLFTFGPVSVGTAYQLREIVKRRPLFMWSDFWYTIKKNLRQSIILGILDLVFGVLFVYDVIFFYINLSAGTFFSSIMFFISLLVILIYLVMRFYMYQILVTFDISIIKTIKNSVIFTVVGFKRNVVALLGIVLTLVITGGVMTIYMPLGIIIPLVIGISTIAFISTYAAYPKIKEIMIDPYYPDYEKNEYEHEDENSQDEQTSL